MEHGLKSGAASGKNKRRDPWRDIKEYLRTQAPEALIDLLLDVAQRDDRLYQSLLLKAERTGGAGGNLAELRVQFKPKRNFIKLLDCVSRSTA